MNKKIIYFSTYSFAVCAIIAYSFFLKGSESESTNPSDQSVDLSANSYFSDRTPAICSLCTGMQMNASQICKNGGPFTLSTSNAVATFTDLMNSIAEPANDKKEFAVATNGTKLEIVLIELRNNLPDEFRNNLYNIAHIYGGTDAAFTIVCHTDAASDITNLLDDEWKNVRIINMSEPGNIEMYNSLLTDLNFWLNFNSQFVLITHIDSTLFRKLDGWMFNYDLIGAPWKKSSWFDLHFPEGRPRVGNGGYTLRRVTAMRTVLQNKMYDKILPEDVWWANQTINLPDESKALEFSAEAYTDPRFIPTGAHKMNHYVDTFILLGGAFRILQNYCVCI